MSLREKILNTVDIKTQLVEIPEWGVTIEVRSLTGKQRSILIQNNIDIKTGVVDVAGMFPDLVILSSYEPETGERVFLDSDREEISNKNSGALDKIFAVASKLSGLESTAVKKAEKN